MSEYEKFKIAILKKDKKTIQEILIKYPEWKTLTEEQKNEICTILISTNLRELDFALQNFKKKMHSLGIAETFLQGIADIATDLLNGLNKQTRLEDAYKQMGYQQKEQERGRGGR